MPRAVKRGPMTIKRPPVLGGTLKSRRAPMPRERDGVADMPIKGSGPKTGDTTKGMGQAARMVSKGIPPVRKGGAHADPRKESTATPAQLDRTLAAGNQKASTSGGDVPGAKRV